MMLATEEINAAGGILGAKIELYVEDFGGDPKVAGSAAEKLITVNKVHVIRGSYTSASMYVIAPIAEKYKIPVLTVGCSAKELTQQGWKYFFKTAPNSTAFNIVAVEFLRKVIEPELKLGRPLKVAIVHDTGLVAVSDKDAFLEQQKRQAPDWQIVAIESYNIGALDFKPIIDKLKAAQPDVVGISAFAGDAALLLKQSAEAGFKPAVWIGIGGGGTQAPKFIELAGDYCKYFFGGSEYWFDRQYPNPKALADFGKRFLQRWGRPLDFQSWTGYAGMYMLKAVIEKYQKIDPEVIREGLATMKFYFDWVGELFFYPNGQMNSIATITQVLPATPQDIWSVKGLTFRTVYPAPYKAADPVFPWKVGG
jgi:branched-chain amino acid transport system substrate-binding protein